MHLHIDCLHAGQRGWSVPRPEGFGIHTSEISAFNSVLFSCCAHDGNVPLFRWKLPAAQED